LKKTLVLIEKDLYYNLKMYACIYIAVILLMFLCVLGFDGSEATSVLNYLVYTCFPSMVVVPYSFHKDDDLSTRNFIRTLPVTSDEILTAKCLLSLITSSIIACTGLGIFNCFGETVLCRCGLIPIMISMIFTSIFILVYYKMDLHAASFTCIIPIVLFALASKNLEENWEVSGDTLELRLLLILLGIVFLFAALMKKMTIKLMDR